MKRRPLGRHARRGPLARDPAAPGRPSRRRTACPPTASGRSTRTARATSGPAPRAAWRASTAEGKWTAFTKEQGLAADLVFAIASDASGDLWIGTVGGLSRCTTESSRTSHRTTGLTNERVYALLPALRRLALDRHGGRRPRPDEGRPHRSAIPPSKAPFVFALEEEPDGSILVGNGDHGLTRARRRQTTRNRQGRGPVRRHRLHDRGRRARPSLDDVEPGGLPRLPRRDRAVRRRQDAARRDRILRHGRRHARERVQRRIPARRMAGARRDALVPDGRAVSCRSIRRDCPDPPATRRSISRTCSPTASGWLPEKPVSLPPGKDHLEFRYTATELRVARRRALPVPARRLRPRLDRRRESPRRPSTRTCRPAPTASRRRRRSRPGHWIETRPYDLTLQAHFYRTPWFAALVGVAVLLGLAAAAPRRACGRRGSRASSRPRGSRRSRRSCSRTSSSTRSTSCCRSCERDPDPPSRTIVKLGDLLRASMRRDAASLVPLHREIDLLKSYLDIQRLRFGDATPGPHRRRSGPPRRGRPAVHPPAVRRERDQARRRARIEADADRGLSRPARGPGCCSRSRTR